MELIKGTGCPGNLVFIPEALTAAIDLRSKRYKLNAPTIC